MTSDVSVLKRARHRVRTHLCEYPAAYLPLARRKYPGPSPKVIGPDTEFVLDGYTRSGSTFAVYAFQLAQPRPVRMAHHLHAPAQLIEAVRRGLPALLLIREPAGAVLSQVIREPDVALPDAAHGYCRYHESIRPYADRLVAADYTEVTTDFGAVIRRLNARFGTSYQPFDHTPSNVEECLSLMRWRGTLSPTLLGFESGTVGLGEARQERDRFDAAPPALDTEDAWIPSAERNHRKAELSAAWRSPALARLRERSEALYAEYRGYRGKAA